MNNTTICNYATNLSQAGIGIIRISGNQSKEIARKILGFQPQPRYAHFSDFLDKDKKIIDEGIAIFYPNPHSFTGEDVFEIQCHGGRFVMENILNQVLDYGATLAEAGEFSKRAFLNGKIDLIQAEAIADLISANSNQAAKSALNSLKGQFSAKINTLVKKITELRMFVESTIDFSDEEIDFIPPDLVNNKINNIREELQNILKSAQQGKVLSEGINIAIIGKPNAGKSSLLNALTQEETAIVTDIEGTTRDILKEKILIENIPCNIIDTAGIRNSTNKVEQEGIKRAKNTLKEADIVLLIFDGRKEADLSIVENITSPIILIRNKCDLIKKQNLKENEILISAKQNIGIEKLRQKIKQLTLLSQIDENIIIARKRHLNALETALKFIKTAQSQSNVELIAEDLRLSQEQLNQITGKFSSDDLLGEIFSSFCIGK